MNEHTTKAWQQYEAGKEYKRRIGLYETVRKNERFYRGDQWQGAHADLPRPVFNIVRRVTDYLVSSVVPGEVSVSYSDDRLPFLDNESDRARVLEGIRLLDRNADYRWKQSHMDALSYEALLDAAISGDGVFYCYWDSEKQNGQPFLGDVRTILLDNTSLFVADVNKRDIQEQNYILLSGRASVSSLRLEAKENGLSKEEIEKIVPDEETSTRSGDLADFELGGDDQKTTFLVRFFKEDGKVIYEKSVKECVIKRVNTGLSLYPVAYFNWQPAKNSFHGVPPVSCMVANQKYINTAYAMAMKHMSDTAFSKVIYDKSRIPEWSNEVGEAIAAMGGGNVADAVSVVGVGKLQDHYLDLIDSVVDNTKAMMGATESALGDEKANNTSAILTLQEASRIALKQVGAAFRRCIGELAAIWADMLCTYSHPDRLLAYPDDEGNLVAGKPDYKRLREELLRATVQVRNTSAYTPSVMTALLDKLFDGGYLEAEDYLELLPDDHLTGREALMKKIRKKENQTHE